VFDITWADILAVDFEFAGSGKGKIKGGLGEIADCGGGVVQVSGTGGISADLGAGEGGGKDILNAPEADGDGDGGIE